MAEITKQFLNSKIRLRSYEAEPVVLSVFRHESPMREVATTVTFYSVAEEARVQRLFLSKDDTRQLAVSLLKTLKKDSELVAVLREVLKESA